MMKAIRKGWTAYLFLLPNFVGVAVFLAFPVLFALYMSFNEWSALSQPKFIGLQNYARIFTQDPLFWVSLKNTAYYTALVVPTGVVVALGIAVAMNQKIRGITLLRTSLYIPVVTSMVAVAVVWSWIFSTDLGLLNAGLNLLGLPSVGWLTDARWAMISLAIVAVWKNMGYYAVILLAALQGVPEVLYEAAAIDGADAWRRFIHITVPMIAHALLFVTVVSIISSSQVFDLVFLMTDINQSGAGGPGTATYVYNLHLYNNAFRYFKMGYASALAYVLFAVIFVVTLLQMRLTRRFAEASYESV